MKNPFIDHLVSEILNNVSAAEQETLLDKNYKTMQEQARKLKVQEDLNTKLIQQQSSKDEYISKLENEVYKLSNLCNVLMQDNEALNAILEIHDDEKEEDEYNPIADEYAQRMNASEEVSSESAKNLAIEFEEYKQEVEQRFDVLEKSLSKLINAYNSHLRDIHDTTLYMKNRAKK